MAAFSLAGGVYVQSRDAAIDRIDVQGTPSRDAATNILLVGLDQGGGRPRADTIVIVRLQPDGAVAVLPIPRDLRNPASGTRLNAAYTDSGPQALIDGITAATGLPVDHYVELDFAGFVALVDDVGGVELSINAPLHDNWTGLDLTPTPCTTLDGATALALVRSRHVDGDNTGELGRNARGQAALIAAIDCLTDVGPDLATIDRLSRVLADHATLDDGLTRGRLADLAHTRRRPHPTRSTPPRCRWWLWTTAWSC
jgi:LCP family protein required for cell wall assembly